MFPPLVINVDAERQACVLDVDLALSRFGLLFSLRVAQEMNVWLVRALWEILDNTQFYLRNPGLLFDAHFRSPDRAEYAELVAALDQWHVARLEADLAGLRVYWAGEARKESLLPKDCDEQLIPRFERLAKCLDVDDVVSSQLGIRTYRYSDFARDTVALTAALVRYRPVIFTRLPAAGKRDNDEEPQLCRYLRRCDIPCRRVDGRSHRIANASQWGAFINRNNLQELFWSGLRVAAVHIVAPGVLALPSAGDPGEVYPPTDCEDQAARRCWKTAQAWWYPLSAQ